MKRCPKCGETKPKSEFYKNAHMKDGLSVQCKKCHNKYSVQYMKEYKIWDREEQIKDDINNFNRYMGGYKMTILNYVKKGEFKYNIESTSGELIRTNDKQEFLENLKDCLC